MPTPIPELPEIDPLWKHLARSFARSHRRRPVSFYLLGAIALVLILGAQLIYAANDPKRLAFFLAINFIFCFVVMYRAIADAFDILRDHRKAERELYEATLGDRYFTRELGERVSQKREASGGRLDWPE